MMDNKNDKELVKKVLNDSSHFMYPEERTVGVDSPMMIYFPNKALMFKIMRACIGINKIEDLWISNNNDDAKV